MSNGYRDEMSQLSEESHKKYENIDYDFDVLDIMKKIINSQTAEYAGRNLE